MAVLTFEPLRLHVSVTTRMGLIAALMASAVGSLPSQILPLTMGAMTDELGLGTLQTSWLASADLIGIAVAAITGFYWIPRVDLYKAVTVGLATFITGNLLVLSLLETHSFWLLFGPRLGAGLGAGLINAAALATLARHPNLERAFALNLVAVVLLASTSYTALPSWLDSAGLQMPFVLMAGVGIGALVVCLRWFPDAPTPLAAQLTPTRSLQQSGLPPLPKLRTIIACIAAFMSGASMMALWAYSERIGVSAGLSLVTVGSLMAFGFLGSSATCFIATWQGNRFGRKLPLLISVVGMMLALYLMGRPAGAHFWVFFGVGVLLFSSMWNYSIPFKTAVIASIDPHGRTIALSVAVSAIAGAVGPMLGGLVAADGDYGRIIVVSGIVFCSAIVMYVGLETTMPTLRHLSAVRRRFRHSSITPAFAATNTSRRAERSHEQIR